MIWSLASTSLAPVSPAPLLTPPRRGSVSVGPEHGAPDCSPAGSRGSRDDPRRGDRNDAGWLHWADQPSGICPQQGRAAGPPLIEQALRCRRGSAQRRVVIMVAQPFASVLAAAVGSAHPKQPLPNSRQAGHSCQEGPAAGRAAVNPGVRTAAVTVPSAVPSGVRVGDRRGPATHQDGRVTCRSPTGSCGGCTC